MNRDQEKIQIENEMNAMHGTIKEDILKDFEEFKGYLKKQVNRGKKLGLDDGKLACKKRCDPGRLPRKA